MLLILPPPTPNFYSRASCEARRRDFWRPPDLYIISTHAPHARRDFKFHFCSSLFKISTHAPHARRDRYIHFYRNLRRYFYSRASCEARPWVAIVACPNADFYSRASCEARPQHLVWHNTNTAVVPQEADKIKRRLSVKNCFSLLLSCFFRRSFPKNQSHLTFA